MDKDDNYQDLWRAAEKATPGPWAQTVQRGHDGAPHKALIGNVGCSAGPIATLPICRGQDNGSEVFIINCESEMLADAEYIALANPTRIKQLISALRSAVSQRERSSDTQVSDLILVQQNATEKVVGNPEQNDPGEENSGSETKELP